MNENLEAERFSKELDHLLAGTKGEEPLDEESAKDLEFAERIVSSDLSNESKVRRSLKAQLLQRAESKPRGFLSFPALSPRFAALCACLAVVAISPLAVELWEGIPTWNLSLGSKGGGGGANWAPPPINARSPIAVAQSSSLGYLSRMPGYAGVRGSGGSLAALKKAAMSAGSAFNLQGSAVNSAEQAAGMSMPAGVGDGSAGKNDKGGSGNFGKDSKSLGESLAFLAAKENQQRAIDLYSKLKNGNAPAPLQPSQLPSPPPVDREGYNHMVENEFLQASDAPLSTFSIDVDVASYANTRRFLNQSRLPPPDAVRVEEFINYFHYSYPEPRGAHPFTITADAADCPWNAKHKLVRVAIKGKTIPKDELPPSNLVFLIDSSGSMMEENKLPLVQKSLRLLVEQLRPQDHVAIVTYAGSAGLILDSTSGRHKADILSAIDRLQAGGTTAGAQGIQLAYQVAAKNLLKKGNNRVILATDGDFNVGVTSDGELVRLIETEREKGVFLTVLGVGEGNYQDAKMQQLADKGNGNYAYLDDIAEAQKVLVSQMAGTLYTVAKDMKIQVEFNPARVQAYRLIGYEKRALKAEDFNNDKKDAGELGSGHTVTALYELIPPGVKADLPDVDELRYQKAAPAEAARSNELLTVKVRYKDPDGTKSKLVSRPLADQSEPWAEAVPDFKFAAAAAGFGMLLRGSAFSGDLSYAKVIEMAQAAEGKDADGYHGEFIRLVEKARLLKGSSSGVSPR